MAHTYTYSGGAGSTAGSMTDIVQTAYNEYIRLQFKPQPVFDALSQAQRVNVGRAPRRGDQASFTIFQALPAATTAEAAMSEGINAEVSSDVQSAVAQIVQDDPTARILICGSLYLAGNILRENA